MSSQVGGGEESFVLVHDSLKDHSFYGPVLSTSSERTR